MRGGGVIAVALGGTLIGFAPILVRISELGPLATNLWRFVFALPILAIWAARGTKTGARDIGWLLLAGVLFGIELNLWAVALTKTTIANATLLANLTPVFAAGFGYFVFKERLGVGVLFGGFAAMVGAVMLAFGRAQGGVGPASVEEGWLGDAMSLVAAVGYAGYLLIVRSLGSRVSVGAVMFWAGVASALFTLVLCLITREPLLPHSLQGWAILIALGVLVQVGGQGLIAYGVGRLPIVVSTVLLWTQPLAAAALSWVMFDERLGVIALVGAGLVLFGLFTVQRARQ